MHEFEVKGTLFWHVLTNQYRAADWVFHIILDPS